MRRNDLRGAKEWRETCCVSRARISASMGAVKIAASLRLVRRSVFEGGDGVTSGGRLDRSRWRPKLGDVGVAGGEDLVVGGDVVMVLQIELGSASDVARQCERMKKEPVVA